MRIWQYRYEEENMWQAYKKIMQIKRILFHVISKLLNCFLIAISLATHMLENIHLWVNGSPDYEGSA